MDVILLERVAKLGQMGEVVKVKAGYARNYLLPQKKALRATDANKRQFETQKADLEARNLEARADAEKVSARLDGKSFVAIRQAGETGQLYGSVSPRDIAETLEQGGYRVDRAQIRLDRPIKAIGIHEVTIALHPEVEAKVTLNVARSSDEAERQASGEDLTQRDRFFERDAADEEDEEDSRRLGERRSFREEE